MAEVMAISGFMGNMLEPTALVMNFTVGQFLLHSHWIICAV